jgi:hypothetical protein
MLVGDRTAGEVDTADRASVGGAFGEIGADQRRFGGKRGGAAGMAPALPLAPAQSYMVRVDSAWAAVMASAIRTASSIRRPTGRWGVVRSGRQEFIHALCGAATSLPRAAQGLRQRPTLLARCRPGQSPTGPAIPRPVMPGPGILRPFAGFDFRLNYQ